MADPIQNTQPGTDQAGGQEAMIPKYRFDEVVQRAQQAEAKVAELQKQIEAIPEKDKRIADLEKELNDTKTGYELEKATAKKNSAIEAALKDKVVDFEVVSKLLDNEKITIDDKGVIKGLDEQVKALQTSKPYLWKPAKKVVEPGGGKPAPAEKTFAQQLAEKKKAQLGEVKKSKTYF